jgi:hypothetical protein
VIVLKGIIRIYSYIFHLLLALFLSALAIVAFSSGTHNLTLGILPWTGVALTWWLLALGVAGVAAVLLAVKGILRIVFFLWALAVVVMLGRGFFFSNFYFSSASAFANAICFMLAAILAAVGAWRRFRQPPAS